MLYRVVLPYAVFGVVVSASNMVSEAAPIGRWMVGKNLANIQRWVAGKRGHVELCEE